MYKTLCVWFVVTLHLWESVHATLKEFENTALLLRLHFLSTLIRNENRAPGKRSSNCWNLKMLTSRFGVDGKHFENGTFRKWCGHDYHLISLSKFSSNTNRKQLVIVAYSNFSGLVWTENNWYASRVKPAPFWNSSGVLWTVPKRSELVYNIHGVKWQCYVKGNHL